MKEDYDIEMIYFVTPAEKIACYGLNIIGSDQAHKFFNEKLMNWMSNLILAGVKVHSPQANKHLEKLC